jgi:hypothetical protein
MIVIPSISNFTTTHFQPPTPKEEEKKPIFKVCSKQEKSYSLYMSGKKLQRVGKNMRAGITGKNKAGKRVGTKDRKMSRNMGNNSDRKATRNSGRNVGRHSGRNLGRISKIGSSKYPTIKRMF